MYIIDNQTGVLLNAIQTGDKLFYSFATEPAQQNVNDDAMDVLKTCEEHKEEILKTIEANKNKKYNYWFFVSKYICFVVDYDQDTWDCEGEEVEMVI